MALETLEPRIDVEIEDNLLDVRNSLEELRRTPRSLAAYKRVCVSVRKAKLLLLSVGRTVGGGQQESAKVLLHLAEEALQIGADAQAAIPTESRAEFELVRIWQHRNITELQSLTSSI